MHIVVLTGSPRQQGTTSLLADNFVEGAQRCGHTVVRFDAAFREVHPCRGCNTCQRGVQSCVIQDDMQTLYPDLVRADLVVLVSPLYYHSMSSQLRMVIDRFRAIDSHLAGSGKQTILLMAGASVVPTVFDGAVATFRETARYLGWKDRNLLLAFGCRNREDIERTNYPERAYAMGREL